MTSLSISLILLAAAIVAAVRRPTGRASMFFGACSTVPLLIAELFLAGAINRLGTTLGQEIESLVTLSSSFLSLGALLALVVNQTISRRLNPSYHPHRHRLAWLATGSGISLVALALGQTAPLALMIGLAVNAFVLFIVDRELIWDAAASSLSFVALFVALDLAFGVRTSGDISHLLLGPTAIGLNIDGLPIERLITVALIGALIGPLFSATKARRAPGVTPKHILSPGKVVVVISALLLFTAGFTWATNVYVLPPMVSQARPHPEGVNVPTTSIDFTFNRPIERQTLTLTTTPITEGAWTFEQPQFGDHGYRVARYVFSAPLPADAQIEVRVSGIRSVWHMLGPDYHFTITTSTPPPVVLAPLPAVPAVPTPETISTPPPSAPTPVVSPAKPVAAQTVLHQKILSVAEDFQDQPLSCEAAALKMALAAHGVRVTESQIMKVVGYDPTPHVGNVWGDPMIGFVGNIDGSQNTTGYGVYWGPIARAAASWRSGSRAITHGTLTDLTTAIDAGDPVVIWGTIGKAYSQTWKTPAGSIIQAWKGEHARTVIGYIGPAQAPTSFVVNDPVVGRLTWSVATLAANWARFNNSGVIVK